MSRILYLEVVMVYSERNTWSTLIVSLAGVTVYVVLVLTRAPGGDLTAVDWAPLMLWTIGAALVGAIVVSILWGIVAGAREPDGVGRRDQRDRDIARLSMRVGQAFLIAGGLGVLVLCAAEADGFWIAHTMFLGFAAASIVGDIASVIAYRRGLA